MGKSNFNQFKIVDTRVIRVKDSVPVMPYGLTIEPGLSDRREASGTFGSR